MENDTIAAGDGRPPTRQAQPEPPAEHPCFKAEHVFQFKVLVSQKFVGQVPGGYRVDLCFEPDHPLGAHHQGYVASATPAPGGPPHSPQILSGNDWVAISVEGVIDFDSRITLRFTDPTDNNVHVPVSARLRGRANVADTRRVEGGKLFEENENPAKVMNAWEKGISNAYLPLRLTVTFDIPREGFSKEETALYNALRPLGRHLFIGHGRANFDGNPYGSVDSIDLGLFRLLDQDPT